MSEDSYLSISFRFSLHQHPCLADTREIMEKGPVKEQTAQKSAKATKKTDAAKQDTRSKPTKIGQKSMVATAGVKKATADNAKSTRGIAIKKATTDKAKTTRGVAIKKKPTKK